jgi:hypothetical protein
VTGHAKGLQIACVIEQRDDHRAGFPPYLRPIGIDRVGLPLSVDDRGQQMRCACGHLASPVRIGAVKKPHWGGDKVTLRAKESTQVFTGR